MVGGRWGGGGEETKQDVEVGERTLLCRTTEQTMQARLPRRWVSEVLNLSILVFVVLRLLVLGRSESGWQWMFSGTKHVLKHVQLFYSGRQVT